jgi:hypothetical protein
VYELPFGPKKPFAGGVATGGEEVGERPKPGERTLMREGNGGEGGAPPT